MILTIFFNSLEKYWSLIKEFKRPIRTYISASRHDTYPPGSKEYNQEKAVFGVCIVVLILGSVTTLTSRKERNPNLEGSEQEPLLHKHREILKTSDDNEPEMIMSDSHGT